MTRAVRKKSSAETPQVFIINRSWISEQTSCPRCSEGSGMITPDEAAAILGVSTRVIYNHLEDGAIHFIETEKGQLFICLKTLVANTKEGESRHG